MKITSKQYAQALYESIQGRSKKEIGEVMRNFACFLVARRETSKVNEIIEHFLKISEKASGEIRAKIKTAHPLDKNTIAEIKKYLTRLLDAKDVVLNTEIDSDILGGIIIQYEDKVIDGSLRGRLEKLREVMRR